MIRTRNEFAGPRLLKTLGRLGAALAAVCMLGTPAANAATTGPQLLPYTITAIAGGAAASPAAGTACAAGSTLTSTDAAGDGCLATQVLLSVPRAVTADSQGNVFIVDSANASIRRVDARTGIITTVAGGGTATPAAGATCGTGSSLTATGTLGDGCLGTQVKLAAPEGIAVDPSDNVWFSDFTLGAVREINHVTGVITTPVNSAGTSGYKAMGVANPGVMVTAAQGQLYRPYGITFDAAGNLYIADNYNNTVEAVNFQASATTIAGISIPAGAIYTIAGAGCVIGTSPGCSTSAYYGKTGGQSPNSTLDAPYQIAVDTANNIYIADEFPYDVRVISGATGILSTYANTAFSRSGVIARGPAAAVSFGSTFGVAVDSQGNVYVSSYDASPATGASYASFITRIDAGTGGAYALAGQATTGLQTGALVAVPTATYCAARTDAAGDGCPATQATLFKPYQPYADAAGNVYIADQGNNLIRKVSTGAQFAPGGLAVGSSSTQSIQVHFSGGDTASSYTLGAGVTEFTLGTAACTTNSDTTTDCVVPVTFKPSAPGVRTASLVVKSSSGSTGAFALTGTGLAPVLALDPGTRTTSSATVTGVTGIALDSAGNEYAVAPGAATLTRITPAGATSAYGSGLSTATAVAVDAAGNVYAALSGGTIAKIGAGGVQTAVTTVATGFTKPSGVAVDAFGNVYVADQSANTVTEIDATNGGFHVLASAAAGISGPSGLAVDAAGNVFVANTVANNVIELPFSGAPITLGAGLSAPAAVAVDAAGSVYVADTKNNRVVLIPNEAGKLTTADQTVILSGLTAPTGIAVSGAGTVYLADGSTANVPFYTRSGSTIAFGNDPTGTQLTRGADIASVGNLPVTLAATYYTASGNTTDFSLTPATLTTGTTFAAGLVAPLTAGFKPTVASARTAAYTFAATNAATPVLTLTGTGITPTNPTTTTIALSPTSGTYGQTVTATITVSNGGAGAAPSGTVNVLVDSTSYTPTLVNGVATLSLPGLSAGAHTVTASYPGDANSAPSSATPATVTLAKAPLTIAVNSLSKAYLAALPTLTGTFTGVVNNDQIGVTYSTNATQTSAIGPYPITAVASGTAASNYTVSVTPGVLTIVKAGSNVTLSASSTAVANTTSVTLTATVTSQTSGVPTGTVTFYNGSTVIGTGAVTLTMSGVATVSTTFAVTGQSSTNNITAVYSGDGNYTGSTSSVVTVIASFPGFSLTGNVAGLIVKQGQTGLTTFSVTPTFGYVGTITFGCTNLPATVGCVFTPASVTSTGANTSSLIGLSLTTVQAGPLAVTAPGPLPGGKGFAPIAFAGIPAVLLLAGFSSRRRNLFRNRKGLLLSALLTFATLGAALGAAGCGNGRFATATPLGTSTITITATGTAPTGATTNIVQQFTMTLTVQ